MLKLLPSQVWSLVFVPVPDEDGFLLVCSPGRWRHGCAVLLPVLWQ